MVWAGSMLLEGIVGVVLAGSVQVAGHGVLVVVRVLAGCSRLEPSACINRRTRPPRALRFRDKRCVRKGSVSRHWLSTWLPGLQCKFLPLLPWLPGLQLHPLLPWLLLSLSLRETRDDWSSRH